MVWYSFQYLSGLYNHVHVKIWSVGECSIARVLQCSPCSIARVHVLVALEHVLDCSSARRSHRAQVLVLTSTSIRARAYEHEHEDYAPLCLDVY